MSSEVPKHYTDVKELYPAVFETIEKLSEQCKEAGPLEPDAARMVKLALAVGVGSEGAVHSHTRQALEEGISKEQIRQVALMAVTTLGFPRAMAALSWMNDII